MSYAPAVSLSSSMVHLDPSVANSTSYTITVVTAMLLHKLGLTMYHPIPINLIPPLLLEMFVSRLGDKGIIETH